MSPDTTIYQLNTILKHNRDGSPSSQNTRLRNLQNMIKHLQEKRGYSKRYSLSKLTAKDAHRLVNDWKENGISHRTIANRLSSIRWLSEKLGTTDRFPSSNKDFGLKNQAVIPKQNKAIDLDSKLLEKLEEREQLITELRAKFGLRTEEALKFQYEYASRSGRGQIDIKGSWAKGGRDRSISISQQSQRDLLERIKEFQEKNHEHSMIPKDSKFSTYYRSYNEKRSAINIPGHELRHKWAQERFNEVSKGILSPLAGGKKYSELNSGEQQRWDRARQVVNRELGHGKNRNDITATYIGSKQ